MASSDVAVSWMGHLGTLLYGQGLRTRLSLTPPRPPPLAAPGGLRADSRPIPFIIHFPLVCGLWLTPGVRSGACPALTGAFRSGGSRLQGTSEAALTAPVQRLGSVERQQEAG